MFGDDFDDLFDTLDRIMRNEFSGGVMRRTYQPSDKDEPTIDVTEDNEHIYITIDLKNVEEENLKITPEQDYISLQMMYDGTWSHRKFRLPAPVDPISAEINYKNYILDIVLRKLDKDELRSVDRIPEGERLPKDTGRSD